MQPLRIRRSDSAPGLSRDQYFGRLGESEIADQDLSDAALRLLAAVRLSMSLDRNPTVCLATNRDLAQLCGRSGDGRSRERWVCRHLAELAERGHVEVERVRTIAGSPRGIRPLGRLRGARCTPTNLSGCNPTNLSARADTDVGAPRQNCRGATTPVSVPLKRESREKKIRENGSATSAATGNGSPPPPSQLEESPEELADALAKLKALPGVAQARRDRERSAEAGSTRSKRGARKDPGVIRQDPPGASGLSVPDTGDRRTEPGGPSTPERGGE